MGAYIGPGKDEVNSPFATVLFTAAANPLSRLIRFVTRSEVSHCAIRVRALDEDIVFEASLSGTRMYLWRNWREHNNIVAAVGLPAPPIGESAIHSMVMEFDTRYDVAALFGWLGVYFFRWLGLQIRNPLASSKGLICSELVALFLLNYPEFVFSIDPENVTPDDILRLLTEKGFARISL